MFRVKYLFILLLGTLLIGCGSSSSPDQTTTQTSSGIPINVPVQSIALIANDPTTITFPIHGQHGPYTAVTIDLARTLEAANFTVSPSP